MRPDFAFGKRFLALGGAGSGAGVLHAATTNMRTKRKNRAIREIGVNGASVAL